MDASSSAAVPAVAAPPVQASRLAWAGVIPFVLGAVLMWLLYPMPEPHAYVALSLSAYGAAVLSFLGGVHWGLAMDEHGEPPRARWWSIVPPLTGTLSVMMPPEAGLVVLGVMLVVTYSMDRRFYPQAHLGHWLTLRFRLTAVAALSCFLAAAAA